MYLPDFLNLGAGFSRYFAAQPAVTDELRRVAYRIRHDVYCRELGYEPVRPDGLETDAYDAHAAHCLVRSKADQDFIGCIRIVFTRPDDAYQPLPVERLCADTIDRRIVDPARLPRDTIAEVSRLAVVSRYRRRRGESARPGGIDECDFGTPERPRFPYLTAGLYLAMMAQARRHGIETLFFLTELRLVRQLTRLGVRLQRIGGAVEHRGQRVPSLLCVDEVIEGFGPLVRPFYEVVEREIDAGYRERGL
jgi:N-acyl amino acid synthase of PEP-CTERM/exosortase system